MSTKEDELEAKDDAAADAAEPEADQPQSDEGGAPQSDDGGEPPEEPPPALEAGPALPDPVRDRLLLPLLLPLLAIAAVALYVLNISRVFLAGGNGAGSVVTGTLVTIAILVGATVISASPRLRSSTLTMTLALMMVVVVSAGLITLGPSEDHGEGEAGGFMEPEGDPTSTLEVAAGPGTNFQADGFTVPGGILEIVYLDRGESHTLVFQEPEFAGFRLSVPGEPERGKVEIEEGEYTIYCDIPGHRAGGMEATVTITEAASPPAEEEGGAPAPGGAPTTTAGP